jgi:hypothetical protein
MNWHVFRRFPQSGAAELFASLNQLTRQTIPDTV